MIALNVVDALAAPGDVLLRPETKNPPLEGERVIIGYMLCPNECVAAIPIGNDQWDGKSALRCADCGQSYFVNSCSALIPVSR